MAIAVGSFVRFAVSSAPPPGVDINANSAMVVTAISTDARGAILTCAREGRYVGTYPQAAMTEVRAPT